MNEECTNQASFDEAYFKRNCFMDNCAIWHFCTHVVARLLVQDLKYDKLSKHYYFLK
jgi:hypothetical protein